MKATRISGEPGGPGIFAVSDGVKAWDAVVSRTERGWSLQIDRNPWVCTDQSDFYAVAPVVYGCLRAESVCADNRRTSISG